MSNRFRAYDKISKETLKMEDDYTFRTNDGGLILTLTEAFQTPRILTIQENTGYQDAQNMDMFEGDRVLFTLKGHTKRMNGLVSRHKSGAWVVTTMDGLEFLLEDVMCDIKHGVGK